MTSNIPSTSPPSSSNISSHGIEKNKKHSKSEQQESVLVIMVIALIQSLSVGANGLLARSQILSAINQQMTQLDNSSEQDKLVNIPAPQRGSHNSIHNQSAISNAETVNKEFMQQNSVTDLLIGNLQQQAQIQNSNASSAGQALSSVVNIITYVMESMKDVTFSGSLTQLPQT